MNLRWGLLAAGTIAAELATGIKESETGELAAVAARSGDRAAEFAARFGIPKSYGSYEELLADDEIDIVYISTPHPLHAVWAINAAEAGKHVLCEKPLTMTHAEAELVIDAARRNDVFLMEAFMYRIHPQIRRMAKLIESGRLGEVRAVDVTFSFDAGGSEASRLADPDLGGGGILDVGCYCTSLARLVSEAATGIKAVAPPEVMGMARLDPVTRVDEVANGVLEALKRVDISSPIVLRLDGTNDVEGRRLLDEARLPNVYPARTMDEAAEKVVALAAGEPVGAAA